jgi:hypothetical protein
MDKLRVWWVLVWDDYYPEGGLGNVRATFLTKGEADIFAATIDTQWGVNVEVVDISRKLGIIVNQWDESSSEDE